MSDASKELSAERKKIVVLAAAIACMSSGPILLRGYPVLLGLWIAVMVVAVVYVAVLFAKLKGKGL